MTPDELTIRHAQKNQPWTVPYSGGVQYAAKHSVHHILASHNVLHAMKTVGKLAAVFEELDHTGEAVSREQIEQIRAASADLVTEALRLANLYDFDLASALVERVEEKNGINILQS